MQRANMGQSLISKLIELVILSSGMMLVVGLGNTASFGQSSEPIYSTTQYASTQRKTPEEVQSLVAPIALYPDALVAQILAASTSPTEIVQADRWLQQHPVIKSAQLAATVDQQPWDPSVKALTAFPA